MQLGVAGEVRCVVRSADGKIKTDTGYKRNLILNQGLDFFGGKNGDSMFNRCAIGSGNTQPTVTQVALDSFIASATGTLVSTDIAYTEDETGLYKTNQVYMYRFAQLGGDVNIAEVGLASQGSTNSDLYLCTRALIKDAVGNATSISVKKDETLDIYYRLWNVHSLADAIGTLDVVDGNGETVAYDYKVRLAGVGGTNIGGSSSYKNAIGRAVVIANGNNSHYIQTGDIGTVRNSPAGSAIWSSGDGRTIPTDSYVNGSYKLKATQALALSQAVGNIRSMLIHSSIGIWQIQYGKVNDDSPIVKTAKDTMAIPFEISWGRFEGEL